MRFPLCVFILFLRWFFVKADCDVIGKKEWAGVSPHRVEYVPRPVSLVIIAHTDTPWCSSSEQCKRSVKSIQDNTIQTKNFDDVGYSFMVGGDGKVYEGVGWIRAGSHTIGYDRTAIGIAFIGNYNQDTPSVQQIQALQGLLKCGVKLGHLTSDFRIVCHRQLVLSQSPGESLYNEITKWPQWLENIDKISGPRSLIITNYAVELGLYDYRTGLLNISGLNKQIYDAVVNGDYNNAVDLSMILDKFGGNDELANVVHNLLDNGVMKTMEYAYKLWNFGAQKIVLKHFPIEFQLIFNEETFKIHSKRDGQALKMDATPDNDGDRKVWGDSNESSSRMLWKMFTIWEGNRVYFKIYNGHYKMSMKMGVKTDDIGDRNVFGSTASDTNRHQWYLFPRRRNNEVLFLIYNREYGQVLKLARDVDEYGDRLLWGNKDYSDDPDIFGWRIYY